MTTIIMSGKHPKIVLDNASMLEIDETYGLMWIHPNGVQDCESYRLNLNMHMVDVHCGEQDNVHCGEQDNVHCGEQDNVHCGEQDNFRRDAGGERVPAPLPKVTKEASIDAKEGSTGNYA
jgi:hypothetical protein